MTALPVITDVLRVSVEGTSSYGTHWANVLHFRKTTALTYAGAIAVLDPKLLTHYVTDASGGQAWKTLAPTGASLVQFRYTPLDGTSASTIIGHPSAGVMTGDALPPGTALVVSVHTAARGRDNRGRVYTGPYGENMNDVTGVPRPTNVAAVLAQWTAFISALTGTGVTWGVASYITQHTDHQADGSVIHTPATPHFTDATTVTVDPIWDSQRRRLH